MPFAELPVRVPRLERPVSREAILSFIAEMVDDLLTDPKWSADISDADRSKIAQMVRQPTLEVNKLPFRHQWGVVDRICLAIQELRLTPAEHREFRSSWLIIKD